MRKSGILLHISSLSNKYGIGTLGKEAYEFVDFLKKSNQKYWQLLPCGPTSYGDSPYQSFSAFAGNPYFIDFDLLKTEGLLKEEDYNFLVNYGYVNYEKLYNTRFKVLRKAYNNFTINEEYMSFIDKENDWLNDYALFMSIKNVNNDVGLLDWDRKYINYNSEVVKEFEKNNQDEINFWKFIQYYFFKQWNNLKKYANSEGIEIIGDMPIYVSLDSCDVWSNPNNFKLDENLNPTEVSGVPPDAFSSTGQLWGNPLYNYEEMEKDGFKWWIKRLSKAFEMYDVVRIDHFRGFEAYYAIPYGENTAINGHWIEGPKMKLFNAINNSLGHKNIIAEDLGILTEGVYQLLRETGYPGMKIMQFAFEPNCDSVYLPHHHIENCIVYTGTHDNTTSKDYLEELDNYHKDFLYSYLHINNDDEALDKFIQATLNSVANTVIIPIQDYLGLPKCARMNTPSTLGNNWIWRLNKEDINDELIYKINNYMKNAKR